ncbi:RWD domain-containing protein 1 [Zancudomyces culisetae]|uniref:RWD domain-containing protein 1 n=1 Tax=Zancudomyces culisetae TaxID=1213189 RepID=A0A1R1PWS7_ZANCU|nr:RWD domain-containing protein 1 [Zancudomyces culisetae]|eukprot:OMH85387.1 RWD domain-containing protein 1 [Zancudomyces culisetae]
MVTYTQQYPDEAPIYEVLTEDEDSCLDSKDLKYLGQQLEQAILDSLGMAMVFTMVTVLKDELMDLLRRKEEEGKKAERERIEKEIELEQLKFIGTKVTRETFMEWKKKFEKEMAEQNKSGVTDTRKVDSRKNKLTGKQLFETDKSLAASDSMFFEDN